MQIKAEFHLQDMIFGLQGEGTIVLIPDAGIQVALLPHVIGKEEALLTEDLLHRHNIEKDVILEAPIHKGLEYSQNLLMTEGLQKALKHLLILTLQKRAR